MKKVFPWFAKEIIKPCVICFSSDHSCPHNLINIHDLWPSFLMWSCDSHTLKLQGDTLQFFVHFLFNVKVTDSRESVLLSLGGPIYLNIDILLPCCIILLYCTKPPSKCGEILNLEIFLFLPATRHTDFHWHHVMILVLNIGEPICHLDCSPFNQFEIYFKLLVLLKATSGRKYVNYLQDFCNFSVVTLRVFWTNDCMFDVRSVFKCVFLNSTNWDLDDIIQHFSNLTWTLVIGLANKLISFQKFQHYHVEWNGVEFVIRNWRVELRFLIFFFFRQRLQI